MAYADGAEEHAVPERLPKRGPAKKLKPAPKKKAARSEDAGDDKSESADGHSDNQQVEEGESEGEDHADNKSESECDDNEDEKSESKSDNEDPDEEVAIPENSYVVVSILAHKLMSDGTVNYRISWKDTKVTTWEPQNSITSQLRADYHKNHLAREEALAAAETAKRARSGRPRRLRQTSAAKAAEKKWLDEWAAAAVLRGVGHWDAYNDAAQAYANKDD